MNTTHIEVVLLDWPKLPPEFLALSSNWTFLTSRFYCIAQTDIQRELTTGELETFEEIKEQDRIIDFCSRIVGMDSKLKRVDTY